MYMTILHDQHAKIKMLIEDEILSRARIAARTPLLQSQSAPKHATALQYKNKAGQCNFPVGNARIGVREGGVRRQRWTAGEAPALPER
jgi:hypothetical protein